MRFPPTLRQSVLEEIRPPADLTRRARSAAREVVRRVAAEARHRSRDVAPQLVGSLYKGTHLRDPLDIDIFLLFPSQTPREALEREGIALGRAVLQDPRLKYAEHPYVHGSFGGFVFDVVPAYRIRTIQGRLSAVDRSPFHARYVKRHLRPAQADEVRLLKRFLRGVGCYGAETAVGGISGYLAELLILKHRDFPRTLRAVASWKPPVALALDETPTDLGGTLVFVDPVDATRNAAAAVQAPTLDRLIRAARAFAKRPRREFFYPNEPAVLSRRDLAKLLTGRNVVALGAPNPPGREETVLPQAHRLLAKFARALEEDGFRILRREAHGVGGTDILLLFDHAPAQLTASFEHRGPKATEENHVKRFLAKWAKNPDALSPPRLVRGRWRVRVRRTRRTVLERLGPRIPDLLQGFDYASPQIESATLSMARSLIDEEKMRPALSAFLRHRDPWQL